MRLLRGIKIKNSIQKKIFLSFILVMVLPTTILSISTYYVSIGILKDKVSSSYAESAAYIGNSVEMELAKVEQLSDYIFANPIIHRILEQKYDDEVQYFNDFKVIQELFDQYAIGSIQPYISSIELVGINNRQYYYGNMVHCNDIEDVKNASWYKKANEAAGSILWMGINIHELNTRGVSNANVSIARAVKNDGYKEIIGMSRINISSSLFSQVLKKVNRNSSNQVLIIDSNNRIVYHPDNKMITTEYADAKYFGTSMEKYHTSVVHAKQYLVAYYHIDKYGWWVVERIPLNELVKENKVIFNITLLVFIVSFIATSFLWYFITSGIVRPIKDLTRAMKSVKEGNLLAKSDYCAEDEIGVMSSNFNFMLERINSLFKTVLEEQAKKKDAEYQALQAQINPHFLYNTLNTIRWMSIIQKADNIKEVVEALGRLIRNTTSKTGQFITVDEELKNLEDYINIQKTRYRDKFEVVFDVQEEVRQHKCVKFILQPLVENAIFHGIEPKEGCGTIVVKIVKYQKCLNFNVRDNGVGMTEEQIKDVLIYNEKKNGFNAIGIKNIDDRIKMTYGEQYGLSIESEPGNYTEMRLTIPVEAGVEGV